MGVFVIFLRASTLFYPLNYGDCKRIRFIASLSFFGVAFTDFVGDSICFVSEVTV